ncbi:hypothetical protein BSKO_03612 [Bryopsis sp. KO-2023]|nr:hypothetical protein BSKO_03612 [Bryopsis sp. KO-2023]
MQILNPAAVRQDHCWNIPPVFHIPRTPVDWEQGLDMGQVWLKGFFGILGSHFLVSKMIFFCDQEMCPRTGKEQLVGGEAAKLQQHKKVEGPAMPLRNDPDDERRTPESLVLPPFLNLPVAAAQAHCKGLTGYLIGYHLRGLLLQIPPEHPAAKAVTMVVCIEWLQQYLVRYKLAPNMEADPCLNATELFGHYVKGWIASAEMQLVARCTSLEAENEMPQWGSPGNTTPIQASNLLPSILTFPECPVEGRSENPCGGLSPMIAEMIKLLRDQLAEFEWIAVDCPGLGPFLEEAISCVVRVSLAAMSKKCGMVYGIPNHHREPGYDGRHINPLTVIGVAGHRRSPLRNSIHKGQNRNEAVMLNSIRRLLGEVTEYKQTLNKWSGSTEDNSKSSTAEMKAASSDTSMLPTIGAQRTQVVKELRTEYSNATINQCRRLAKTILSQPGNMVANSSIANMTGTVF